VGKSSLIHGMRRQRSAGRQLRDMDRSARSGAYAASLRDTNSEGVWKLTIAVSSCSPSGESRMSCSRYPSNLTGKQWSIVEPLLPSPKRRGRRRRIRFRSVIDAIFYLLRTGCQWRQLPRQFPPWSTVYWHFRSWDGQSVKTTEVGGTRGFDAFKRVKGRKRHILVIRSDCLSPIASRLRIFRIGAPGLC